MPSNNDKYKDETLFKEIDALRKLHLELKDAVHADGIHHQTTVPRRKELIALGSVYTTAKNHVVRLAKARDKKVAKENGAPSRSKLRVVRVDANLSKFLRLKERGLPVDMYPDTVSTSYFTNWVVATGRQNGKEVKLFGPTDEFVILFGDDLKKPGSGPKIKDPITGQETLTSVLDATGAQINPFYMNKHMTIFKDHYPQVVRNTNGKIERKRDVISRDQYPEVYEKMQLEHDLFTNTLGDARKRYRRAQDNLAKLQDKREKAFQVGDTSISYSIQEAQRELNIAKKDYISLLTVNSLTTTLTMAR